MSDITYYVQNSSNKDLVSYYNIMNKSWNVSIDRVNLLAKFAIMSAVENDQDKIHSYIDDLKTDLYSVVKYAGYVREISEEIDRRGINEEVFD